MLLILCGKTCVGKDTYQDFLLERNEDLSRAVSHTTRPKRRGETEGKEYYFVDDDQFMELYNLADFIETRQYKTIEKGKPSLWSYGLSEREVVDEDYHIAVLDHQGIKKLLRNKPESLEVKVVYLFAPDDIVRKRSIERGDEIEEFERRLADDKKEFRGIDDITNLVIYTNVDDHEENLLRIERLFWGR